MRRLQERSNRWASRSRLSCITYRPGLVMQWAASMAMVNGRSGRPLRLVALVLLLDGRDVPPPLRQGLVESSHWRANAIRISGYAIVGCTKTDSRFIESQ
jgi:hypothetical protein